MEKTVNILKKPAVSSLIAILFGFIVVAIILRMAGYHPFLAIEALINGVFGRPKYISNVVIKSTPIIITGLSVTFAYKMGMFNIGVEGQYIMGAITATACGILFDFPPLFQILSIIIAGALAGAAYGGIAGILKAKFGINEVIVTIMLNWIALYFSNLMCRMNILHKPETSGTYSIRETGYITILTNWKTTEAAALFFEKHPIIGEIMRTDLNAGFVIAVVLAILAAYFLKHTTKGLELCAVGAGKDAAEFAGINIKKNIVQTMVISGGLAGIAAAIFVAGNNPHNVSSLLAFEGNGLNGLPVAFIAGASPIGCIFSGLFFGSLLYGGQSIQYIVGAPSEIISIMIGIIVFFTAFTKSVPVLADKLLKRGER